MGKVLLLDQFTGRRVCGRAPEYNPGMIGWPVPEGQAQIFALVDAGEAGVHLTEGGMMVPRKSLSLVLGEGAGLEAAGSACAFCSLQATCRYQDHYPPDPPRGG